jgi:hypothetical protein
LQLIHLKDQDKRVKAVNALDFLTNHPALSSTAVGSFFNSTWFSMIKCCKRGKCESSKHSLPLYRGEEGWKRFKDRFDEVRAEESYMPPKLDSIFVTYEELYGEPWKFDHVEYKYEISFFVFDGNPYNNDWMYRKNWLSHSGPKGGANTFEDMVIKAAKQVRRVFGSFDSYRDFQTEEEIKNHKENECFFFKPITKGKHKGCSRMIRNPKHVDVHDSLINLRWLKWFSETPYAKKNWQGEFDKYLKRLKKNHF